MPLKVVEIELGEGLKPIRVKGNYEDVYALIRFRGQPLGWLTMPIRHPIITVTELRQALLEKFSGRLMPLALGSRHPEANQPKSLPVSVVVCTRDRADQLRDCLGALAALDCENNEIIVVDNAPANDETARLCMEFPVRYVCEKRPGLDWARNRGIAEAKHPIIAFTDDDARPDARWLQAISDAFTDPEIMAVTGLVAPAELETDAQIEFEINYGGMSHGFNRRYIRRDSLSDNELLWASSFGVGANMAFRKALFDSVGTFDVALDVGTPSGGGGDVEFLHRIVAEGFTLLYEPAALVWHTHRRDRASLRRQLHQNGTGFGSYLLTSARAGRLSVYRVAKFTVRHWLGGWIVRRLLRRGGLPRRYVLHELHGAMKSPFSYLASHRRAAQVREGYLELEIL